MQDHNRRGRAKTTAPNVFGGPLPSFLQTGRSPGLSQRNGVAGGNTFKVRTQNAVSGPVMQRNLAETAAMVRGVVEKYEGIGVSPEQLKEVREYLMLELREEFAVEYEAFLKQDAGRESVPDEIEIKTALREYIKALTSSLASKEGWEDVAILHKRKSKAKGPSKRMKDEREKYHTIGHHTAEIWGTGSHAEMEESGQVYGPATAGMDDALKAGGKHSWGANAAWLLGHMHAGHRFIQVVPHTEDNLNRGSSGNEGEVGALAYEALKLMQAGYTKGREAEGTKLWTEYVPTAETMTTRLTALARGKGEKSPDAVKAMLQKFDLWAKNISVEDVIALDSSPDVKSAYDYVQMTPTWTDKEKGFTEPYLARGT